MTDQARSLLANALQRAILALDLASLVRQAVARRGMPRSADVLAVGKAGPRMLHGALDALGAHVARALVVTTDGTRADFDDDRVRVLRAAHPVPDARSAGAATAVLEFTRSCSSDQLLVLVSGGTSSLLCAPFGASLEQYQLLAQAMLRSGVSVQEMNVVRRHTSAVHGGRIALRATVPVHTVIASDVIGGAPHDIGSGPASADPTTVEDASEILHRVLSLAEAQWWERRLQETPKPGAWAGLDEVVARPEDLAAALAAELRKDGIDAVEETLISASAGQLVDHLVARAEQLGVRSARVVACEPTLAIPGQAGRGGRAGWVALAALGRLPGSTTLLAAASDGVDGCSGAGGAIVRASQAGQVDPREVQIALDTRSDASVHERLGTHLPGIPTGLNLTDVYAVAKV